MEVFVTSNNLHEAERRVFVQFPSAFNVVQRVIRERTDGGEPGVEATGVGGYIIYMEFTINTLARL